MTKLAITPKEAAALSPFGENRIRELAHNDPTFPAFRNGPRDIIIPVKAFEAWLERQAEYRTGYPEHARLLGKTR